MALLHYHSLYCFDLFFTCPLLGLLVRETLSWSISPGCSWWFCGTLVCVAKAASFPLAVRPPLQCRQKSRGKRKTSLLAHVITRLPWMISWRVTRIVLRKCDAPERSSLDKEVTPVTHHEVIRGRHALRVESNKLPKLPLPLESCSASKSTFAVSDSGGLEQKCTPSWIQRLCVRRAPDQSKTLQ